MAWITLLTKPAYLAGVRTLRRSLQDSGSRYPLVVMVTDNIAPDICRQLENEGCLIRPVQPLQPNSQAGQQYANPRFAEVWTKLCAWSLTEFRRLVFLDADMLVLRNMDELFTQALPLDSIAACHACRCNPYRIPSYPASWVPENCFYTHCATATQTQVDAPISRYFNSGFMVLTPDTSLYDALIQQLAGITDLSEYLFPEQDLLNQFFADRWVTLPYTYNALKTLSVHHTGIWHIDQVKNLHFILEKPWDIDITAAEYQHDPYLGLYRRWWNARA
ncbi:glycosyltransferase family 8 protein [Biostraticola tofi]|uniref:Glycosyl transferase family 8 n=1 Tax=Biostraticola tofi TaxID=466109 RepID=A0A4R3YRY1_9GAMM|nr:glycosyltransferase family 8 protein [Biostraticola tofi]TCV95220.1 glycosyl transferase family 8 [Biostraticola tofi]